MGSNVKIDFEKFDGKKTFSCKKFMWKIFWFKLNWIRHWKRSLKNFVRSLVDVSEKEGLLYDQRMLVRCGTLFNFRGEDPKRLVVKVANYVYG